MAKAKFKPNVSSKASAAPCMVYAWKPDARILGKGSVNAQVVGETLEQIEARHGALRPVLLVDEARPATSPIHLLFDWDDAVAAEKFRLHQARKVISAVVVERIDNREIQRPISAYVNMIQGAGHSYVSTVAAMSDEEKRQTILLNARDDLLRWRHKYEALVEFAELHAVIDSVVVRALEPA